MALPSLIEPVHDNGYRWWYIDAISDDSQYALTAIVFIGCVFSPWYAWARKKAKTPALGHCSVNLALYGPKGRWCMTERNADSVRQSPERLQIGPSALSIENDCLTLSLDEWSVPLPSRMRGELRITLPSFNARPITLDAANLHQWQPVAPRTRIRVHMNEPSLTWSGDAYVDSNSGSVPLEQTFQSWTWSRSHEYCKNPQTPLANKTEGQSVSSADPPRTLIRYDTCERGQSVRQRTFEVTSDNVQELTKQEDEQRSLPHTFWFRIPRQTRCAPDAEILAVDTLEDTPFYSRSRYVEKRDLKRHHVVHESVFLDRFDHPITRLMLPFRMPRIPHPVKSDGVKEHA